MAPGDGLHQRLHGRGLAHVAGLEFGAASSVLGQLLGLLARAHHHRGACGQKALGNGAANALGAAGDEHHLLLEVLLRVHGR